MPFASRYATLIWDNLYICLIPDNITLNPDYIRKFGVYSTGNSKFDKMLENSFTTVKIPIIQMLEYYLQGIEIQIPSRDDLIKIHKDIELYLGEWKEHIKYDINLDINSNKELIVGLEKLSKVIYNKANPREIIDNLFIQKKVNIGLMNPLQQHIEENKEVKKPDYDGISKLIKKPKGGSRF